VIALPSRGEVWHASFDPVQGHEQGFDRLCLVVSTDPFNHGPGDLVIVVLITMTQRNTPLHVAVDPPDGGLSQRSYVMCEQIRVLDIARLLQGYVVRRYGTVSTSVLREVEDRLRTLLELYRHT
jgi:mRNA interferase MazF